MTSAGKRHSYASCVRSAGWTAAGLTDLLCIHHYLGHLKYDGAALRRDLQQYLAISRQLRKPLYIGEFGVLDGQGQLAADFDATAYQAHARDMFQALYETQVPLACWWVYAVKPHGFGMGAVNPVYGKFDYIVDLLAEYNDKIASASGGRPNP